MALGYTYSEQGKCYYADAHEREDVVRYRIKFVGRYLNAYEVYMKRWIQVSLRDLKAVLKGKEIEIDMQQIGSEEVKSKKIDTYSAVLARGLTYQDENGEEMIELHMDTIVDKAFSDIHFLLQNAVDDDGVYGFNQSVFRPDKTKKVLISIGQDECIFKQFLVLKKAWMLKSGRFHVRPKDDGSMMISAFQSREFSFGFPLFNKYKIKSMNSGEVRNMWTKGQQMLSLGQTKKKSWTKILSFDTLYMETLMEKRATGLTTT